jgi:hypothetical protein
MREKMKKLIKKIADYLRAVIDEESRNMDEYARQFDKA